MRWSLTRTNSPYSKQQTLHGEIEDARKLKGDGFQFQYIMPSTSFYGKITFPLKRGPLLLQKTNCIFEKNPIFLSQKITFYFNGKSDIP